MLQHSSESTLDSQTQELKLEVVELEKLRCELKDLHSELETSLCRELGSIIHNTLSLNSAMAETGSLQSQPRSAARTLSNPSRTRPGVLAPQGPLPPLWLPGPTSGPAENSKRNKQGSQHSSEGDALLLPAAVPEEEEQSDTLGPEWNAPFHIPLSLENGQNPIRPCLTTQSSVESNNQLQSWAGGFDVRGTDLLLTGVRNRKVFAHQRGKRNRMSLLTPMSNPGRMIHEPHPMNEIKEHKEDEMKEPTLLGTPNELTPNELVPTPTSAGTNSIQNSPISAGSTANEKDIGFRFSEGKRNSGFDMRKTGTADTNDQGKPSKQKGKAKAVINQMKGLGSLENKSTANLSPHHIKFRESGNNIAHRLKGLGNNSDNVVPEPSNVDKFMDYMPNMLQRQDTKPVGERNFVSLMVDLTDSSAFDYSVGTLIMLNAISIGVQTDYMARNKTDVVPAFFRAVEIVFCILFSSEIVLRIYVHRCFFFCSTYWKWNLFDTIVVGLQISEEIIAMIASSVDDDSPDGFGTDTNILRMLRLVRIIRLVRVVRLIGELHTFVISIIGSIRSFCWTLVLMLFLMYSVGVYFTQLISDHMLALEVSERQDQEKLDEYFGDLGSSVLTLFQSVTGGVSWIDVVRPLSDFVSPWLTVLFAFYIAFCVFAMMNIVTGVFVESALETARKDKDLMLLQSVKHLFTKTDKDGSGDISWEEFQDQLHTPEMTKYFEAIDLDLEEAKELFRLLDCEGTGQVDVDEFVNGSFRLRGNAKAIDLATIMSDFNSMMKHYQIHTRQVESALQFMLNQQTGVFTVPPTPNSHATGTSLPASARHSLHSTVSALPFSRPGR